MFIYMHLIADINFQLLKKPQVKTGMHNPRPRTISGPRSRVKNTKNFSWTTEILWMNSNFIELLTILPHITIGNSSDGNKC